MVFGLRILKYTANHFNTCISIYILKTLQNEMIENIPGLQSVYVLDLFYQMCFLPHSCVGIVGSGKNLSQAVSQKP